MNRIVSLFILSLIALSCPAFSKSGPLAEQARTQAFSSPRMMETVRFLASDELKGRGLGTPELDRAAEYIAQKFKQAGLKPGGDSENSYFQEWEEPNPPSPPFDKGGMGGLLLKNIVGVIPGKKQDLSGQSIVIGAHYDHLGMPGGRKTALYQVYRGADDNASGVAALIELAQALGKTLKPDRSVVFIAFTGEEAGKLGSKYYVRNEKRYPAEKCVGMVNLDTVGRLGRKKLLVLGAGSAKEWLHIFRSAGSVAGVEVEAVAEELDSSDQKSFQEAGVPAVQLFSGPHPDYHRPADTPDKIDTEGLMKVASVTKEVIEHLASREAPLTSTISSVVPAEAPKKERRVSLGTIPDFAYQGTGVRLSGVMPGSSAEKVELEEGDIIIRVNDVRITSLKDYSDFLKTLKPGDRVLIVFMREGREISKEAEARER